MQKLAERIYLKNYCLIGDFLFRKRFTLLKTFFDFSRQVNLSR